MENIFKEFVFNTDYFFYLSWFISMTEVRHRIVKPIKSIKPSRQKYQLKKRQKQWWIFKKKHKNSRKVRNFKNVVF